MEKKMQANPLNDMAESRGLLLAGIAAPVVLTVAIVLAGYYEPDYSHVSQYVSELGAVGASHQRAFNYGGLFLSGLLTVLFALGLYLRVKPRALLVAISVLAALAGVGRLVAGLFPCDAGCNMEEMSIPATIHASAAFIGVMSGVFAPILLAIGLRRCRQNILFRLSAGLGSASLVLAVFFFGFGKGLPYIGVIQRLILAAFYVWVIAVALTIDALQPDDRRRD
jgi:hypothetical membrane protein